MKAVIMAGGHGSRMRPLTCNKPKPMVPILNKPVMTYTVELLKKYNITDIAVTLQYLPEAIKDYFGDGSAFGVNLHYFEESTPLGTAGGVKNATEFFDDTFFVISGDGITNFDLLKALDFHKQKGGIATLVMTKVSNPLEYGVIMCDDNNRITRFLEKPDWSEVFSDTINTGIYILEPEIFDHYARDVIFDFSKDLFPRLLAEGKPMYGYVASGYWSDIGSLDQYRQTQNDIMDGLVDVKIPGKKVEEGLWIGEGTILGEGVQILQKPIFIGENCVIGAGTQLGEYTVIGDNNSVGAHSTIKRSIFWERNYINEDVAIHGTVIANNCRVHARAALFEGTVIGDNSIIGKKAIVKPSVKIWPDKVIEDNATVSTSIVWGHIKRRGLFSNQGVKGIINTEISAEMMVKLALAYGTNLPLGGQVTVGSDHHRASQVIKKAVSVGLLSAGLNVLDIGVSTTPISRYAIKSLNANAGIHIRIIPPVDSNQVIIEFLDEKGINISTGMERKVENTFTQEDFRRPDINHVGEIKYVPQMTDSYREGLLKNIDTDMIKRCHFKVMVAYDYLNLAWFIPPLLEKLGCRVVTVNSVDYTLPDLVSVVVHEQVDMGVFLSSNADEVILFTPNGDIINEELLLTLWSHIALDDLGTTQICLPVTAPAVIEKMADARGCTVLRTKIKPRAVMESSQDSLFQPLFDGAYMFLKVLEYLQRRNLDLLTVFQDIPKSYIVKLEVECPFEDKGMVMKRLLDKNDSMKVEMLDGIKMFYENGWVLVLPDSEEPIVWVISEGTTSTMAEQLAEKCRDTISMYNAVV